MATIGDVVRRLDALLLKLDALRDDLHMLARAAQVSAHDTAGTVPVGELHAPSAPGEPCPLCGRIGE